VKPEHAFIAKLLLATPTTDSRMS